MRGPCTKISKGHDAPVAQPSGLARLATAFVLANLALLGACSGVGRDESATNEAAMRDPGYSATDAQILQTGPDGQPRYRLQAARIAQDPRTLEVELTRLRLDTRAADRASWTVSAPRGRLSADSRRLDLDGGVELQGSDASGADPLRLETADLQYDLQTARARARGEVRLTLQGHALEAKGLEANLRTRQVRLAADVHGHFAP
jgi:LPS export ABC transporter protein LptC